MTSIDLPAGRYLSCPIDLGPDYGGQTRALLLRNRLLVSEAGISPSVLSFSARPDLARRREQMLERGMLVEQIATPNIYAHYREHGWGTSADTGRHPISVKGLRRHEEQLPDATPWRIGYTGRSGQVVMHDYLRPDGTPYLRIPTFVFKRPQTWPSKIQQLDRNGAVVGQFDSIGQFFRRWVREMSGGERSFVFIDSRYNAQHLVPMKAPNIHVIYVLHNIHIDAPRLWSSPVPLMYHRILERADRLDALVCLTERQRDDIAERRGRSSNLFVVPHPVEMHETEQRVARDPNLVALVARLEGQKRITQAVAAFDLVHQAVPTARFDIYGEGSRRSEIQREIGRRGLDKVVTLKGHDPHARDALARASAFLVTSAFEGWNLALQESMSHGCPVVSYDVKYGPREQISDGVDGYLVPDGDQQAMAERVVQLLRDPGLVASIGAAGVEKTAASRGRFLLSWKRVLDGVVDLKPRRTHLQDVELDLKKLEVVPRRLRSRLRALGSHIPRVAAPDDTLRALATLTVTARPRRRDMESARITLFAVSESTGHTHELPVLVSRRQNCFTVRCSASVAQIVGGAGDEAAVHLRLRLVWENSTWETMLSRPNTATDHTYELAFDARQRLEVVARG